MAQYPSALITYTNPAGTSLLASGPDHAADHTSLHGEVIAIETTVGTNSGTNILKNFVAGDLAARINNETFGSATLVGGTIKNVQLIGTSQITGGTLANGLIGTSTIQGGTVANAAIGTPTIIGGTVAINGTTVPLNIGAGLVPTVVTLTDAIGTITPNAQAGQVFNLTLGTSAGNRTLGTPNNPTEGQNLALRVKNAGTANGTLVFTSVFRFPGGTSGTLTLGTVASSWNYFNFRYNGVDSKWDALGAAVDIV